MSNIFQFSPLFWIFISFREVVTGLDTSTFTTDPHIPDLLVFPASTDFHRNKLYLSGEIILQDKVRDIISLNPTALRKAKIAYNVGLSGCSGVKLCEIKTIISLLHCNNWIFL